MAWQQARMTPDDPPTPLRVERTTRFKRDYKREKRIDAKLDALLLPVLEALVAGNPLRAKHSDHALTGNWRGFRDCHIKPDLVLIYSKSDHHLTLVRLGSHSELFG